MPSDSETEACHAAQDAVEEHKDIIETKLFGYHPALVYYHKDLLDTERKEARWRFLGRNLTKKSDMWLLHNLWKTLAGPPIAIPIVFVNSSHTAANDSLTEKPSDFGHKDGLAGCRYALDSQTGFLQIAFDFDVWELADFLERILDDARSTREAAFDSKDQPYNLCPAYPHLMHHSTKKNS